jgi:hypothetical protein
MSNANSPFISPTEPLISIFDIRGMVPSQVEQLVPLMNPQFQRPVISKVVNQMQGAIQTKAGNRYFKVYRQPNDFPSFTIDTRTASGSNLILTATDSSFQAIPIGHQVFSDATGCLSEVIDAGAGFVTVQFVSNPNGNTAFVSADFAADSLVADSGQWGNINNRQNPQTVFTLPIEYDNIIGQFDAGAEITHEDVNNKTYLSTPFGNAYAMMKEKQALERMYQSYYSYMMKDAPMVNNANKPLPSSWLNQIKTMGGLQVPISAPLTLTALRNTIRAYVANGGFTGDEIVVTCGSQYLGDAQEALEPYVLTAGDHNVVGGQEVKGLNIYMYGFEGLKLKFIKDPYLDNKQIFGVGADGFSKRSRSAIWMSTDRVQTENGGTLPFVCDYYFGSKSDVQRWEVQGSMDSKGNSVNVGSTSKKAATVNFTLDKTTQLMNPSGCLYHGN